MIFDENTEGGMLGRKPGSVDGASPGPLVEGLIELAVGCDDDSSLGEKLGS